VSALSAAEGERGVDKREVRGLYLTVYWRKIGWNRAVLESCAGNVLGADSQRELAKGALTALSCWRKKLFVLLDIELKSSSTADTCTITV